MNLYYKQDGKLKVVEVGDSDMTIAETIDYVKIELKLDKTTVFAKVYEKVEPNLFTLKEC